MFPVRYGRRNSCTNCSLVALSPDTGSACVLQSVWGVRGCVGWDVSSGRGRTLVLLVSLLAVSLALTVRTRPVPRWGWWCGVVWVGQALGLLVPVGWALLLYTSGLSTPCSVGALPTYVVGNLILKRASRLDAFSGYHFRT